MKSVFLFLSLLSIVSSFQFATPRTRSKDMTSLKASMAPSLIEPQKRDVEYGSNVARYLIDLHDAEGTFDFCGGMMFQLVLSDKLRQHLESVASANKDQPVIYDASHPRMFNLPNYKQNADADNMTVFHGRELRKVPGAEGGFGFVLQLSYAGEDPEGWSKEEILSYDGWGHDSGRQWRKADDYEAEGFQGFKQKFGENAFGLNHRFYLHYDSENRMWLSAEDGCEGTPSAGKGPLRSIFGF